MANSDNNKSTGKSIKSPDETAELIQQLRNPATCRKAMDQVIKLYTEPLYWQIRRLVQRHEDADDILQNTFIKAWMSIENFRGDAKLSTWLHKIAINESLTHLANEKKRTALSLDNTDDNLINSIEADQWVDGDETAQLLRKAIATLPEKQRIVFNMRYFDEIKYEEMSEILGTSVGALKASYHLAVKKIEEYIDQHNVSN